MPIRGTKPKAKALAALEGNPSHRKQRGQSRPIPGSSIPSIPEWVADISDEQRRELLRKNWLYFGTVLKDLGILIEHDLKQLELLVTTSVEVHLLELDVLKNGTYSVSITKYGAMIERARPAAQQLAEAKRRMQSLLTSVGLTPEARNRYASGFIAVNAIKDEEDAAPLLSGSHRNRRFRVLEGGA